MTSAEAPNSRYAGIAAAILDTVNNRPYDYARGLIEQNLVLSFNEGVDADRKYPTLAEIVSKLAAEWTHPEDIAAIDRAAREIYFLFHEKPAEREGDTP